ncbi:MAG: HAMP domain-containing histidine kinase [Clostridiales bacterium]|nr:HAMP domain-containing histidine kinase [Clostridiales bacterium]
MSNKIELKKSIIISLVITIIFSIFMAIINIYEYKEYTKNFNKNIASIIDVIQSKYPEISTDEIIGILNSEKIPQNNSLKKYGIDLEKNTVILENNKINNKFIKIEIILLITTSISLLIVFMLYERKQDKEIDKITKYLEAINDKNYTLKIDENSEEELSILKNELYKVTVMLRENASNTLKDKINLKRALEDISHQLKTPLTSILIILDNLIDNPEMEYQTRVEFLHDLKRETTRIQSLIQSILKLSKFDSNTIQFIKQDIYLKQIIDEAIKNTGSLADLKNIKINVEGNKKIKLNCDLLWQIEAITNILKNCIEHSKENTQIDIKYNNNSVYSYITITDYGEGISKEDLPHIFERFYRGKNSSNESIGIGLSLSKTIIESNNGIVSVESNSDKTTFIIKYFKL